MRVALLGLSAPLLLLVGFLAYLGGVSVGVPAAAASIVLAAVMGAAKSAGLQHPTTAATPEAPAPVAPRFELGALRRLGDALGYQVHPEPNPGSDVRVLVMDNKSGYGCLLPAAGAARCQPNDTKLGSLAVPLSGAGDEWVVYDYFEKDSRVVFGAKGFPAPVESDAFVLPDGSVVGWDRDKSAAVHITRAGKITSTPLALPGKRRVLNVAAGYLFLLDEAATGDATLHLQELTAPPLAKPVEVGKVPRGIHGVTACRDGDDLAAILGVEEGTPERTTAVSVWRTAGAYAVSPALELTTKQRSTMDPDGGLRRGCRPRAIDLTWVRSDALIGRLSCTAEKCVAETSQPLPGPPGKTIRAASLGDNVLVARIALAPSPLRATTFSLQMRMGPMAKLHEGPWQIVLGMENVGGPKTVFRGVDVVAMGEAAVLLSYSDAGLYGARVDKKGALAPLE